MITTQLFLSTSLSRAPQTSFLLFHMVPALAISPSLAKYCEDDYPRRYLNIFLAFATPGFYVQRCIPSALSHPYALLQGLVMWAGYRMDTTGRCRARGYGLEIIASMLGNLLYGLYYSRSELQARMKFAAAELEPEAEKLVYGEGTGDQGVRKLDFGARTTSLTLAGDGGSGAVPGRGLGAADKMKAN